ncbi:response regulator transcription factor [Variovorax rhizosphaerae]|uniref:Response regulator n=1 Tax=Variovorax rhizosphaerae TaxID=1836200 RepID=A0ABU8X0W2_9BURK
MSSSVAQLGRVGSGSQSLLDMVPADVPRQQLVDAVDRMVGNSSREHFLATLELQAPACAIVDVQMPGLSGFEVLARMRATNVHVPVIFITASDEDALDSLAMAATATRLLRKPFSSTELLAAIAIATGLRTP